MVPTAEKRRACGGCRETEPVHHRARTGRHRGGREPAFGLQRPQGGLPHPVRRGGPPLLRQHRLRGREPASGGVEGQDQALPQPEPRPHVLLRVHRHASGLLPGSQELRRRLDRRAGKQEPHVQRGPAGLPALQRMGARAGGGHRPRRRGWRIWSTQASRCSATTCASPTRSAACSCIACSDTNGSRASRPTSSRRANACPRTWCSTASRTSGRARTSPRSPPRSPS